ncbi:MAG: Zn-dependent alcohol dehydrogenase [Ardenticatenaceae bacterium]|nr:Zn-dependent alcohol dehydrogenase [Ardenticatenaceae bacterium]HBY93771.1 alcohol dehydrogenase [Chloroflexota bacterium]
MKTNAAVTYEPGQPLVIEELELDEPKAGEVRVKMAAVGLCHSDYHVMAGDRPVGMRPMVLGHEGAGVVDAVGPGVTRIRPGDHVVLMFIPACGKCRYCLSGMTHACVLSKYIAQGPQIDGTYRLHNRAGQDVGQFCLVGAFSESTVVNQDSLCVIDQRYPLEVACLVGCCVVGGFGAAVNRARVTPGSSVLVIGVGGVGTNVIQGAVVSGATTIIAADVVDRKLAWAREFGATHTVNMNEADLVARVVAITGGTGVDFAFEAISSPETIAQAYAATAKLGTTVVIGLTPAQFEELPISPLNLVLSQKTLMGTIYGTSNAPVEIPKLLNLYRHGHLKLDELVTRTYTLDEINQGYEDMLAGKNIRGVVVF